MCMYRVQLDLNRIEVLLDNKSKEKDNKFESVNKRVFLLRMVIRLFRMIITTEAKLIVHIMYQEGAKVLRLYFVNGRI